MQTKGQLSKDQSCFFVCTTFDSFLNDTATTESGEKATKEVTIPATGHTYGNPTFAWSGATCKAAFKCTKCAAPSTVNCTVKSSTVAATCTKAGATTYTASVVFDGKTYNAPANKVTIKAKGHKFSAWKTTKKATVFAKAVQQRTCSVCKTKETRSYGNKVKASIALNAKGTLPLKVKQTFTVKVTKGAGDSVKSFKSSNTKVATVSKSGKVTAKKSGTAKITVTLKSGKKASFNVKVQKTAVKTKSVKLAVKTVTLKKGKSYKLSSKVTLNPITSKEKIKYSTKSAKIATVSSAGTIKAKKKGTTYITVKSGSKSAKVKVVVK